MGRVIRIRLVSRLEGRAASARGNKGQEQGHVMAGGESVLFRSARSPDALLIVCDVRPLMK